MKLNHKITLNLTDDEYEILKITRDRHEEIESVNEVMRHLIVYQGLVGGTFPLTTKILNKPASKRKAIEERIVNRLRANIDLKPQAFYEWIKEALGTSDPEAIEGGAEILLKKLMEWDAPPPREDPRDA